MNRVTSLLCTVLCAFLVGCASLPPSGWQQGGARLHVAPLRWVHGELVVDVDGDGRIRFNGRHVLTLDSAGRVYDLENEPVALLDPEGYVAGPNDRPLGWVGAHEAILPGDEHSWLALQDDGLLLRYDDDGDNRPFGVWFGCDAYRAQTCMLVSHLVGSELRTLERRRGRFSVGIGVGVGIVP